MIHLPVRGPIAPGDVPGLGSRIRAAVAGPTRWLIVDMSAAGDMPEALVATLDEAAADLRRRRGELVVSGAGPAAARRLSAPGRRSPGPALAASAEQAMAILKVLRPGTSRAAAA